MKKLLLALVTSTTLSPIVAFGSNVYKIKLDWEKKSTLTDSVVQMCDDNYYSEIQLVIPGRAYQDFTIEMDVDIGRGNAEPGCDVQKKESRGFTTYTFKANSSCEVHVYERSKTGGERKSAVYGFSEAC